MDSVIYYFSGSGNSYNIAKKLQEKLNNTELIRITSKNMHLSSQNQYKKVGIVFPVYYFSLPKMVKEFVGKLNLDSDSYIYAVATCGGFVGVSLVHLKQILDNKGEFQLSTFKIVMPDNYQVLYSPASEKKQHELIIKSGIEVEKMLAIVQENGIHNVKTPNYLLVKMEEIGSNMFKPKNKDKNFWTNDNCNGCSICEKLCPANDIVIEYDRPRWLNNCEQCLACMQWCPKEAIQYKKSTVNRGRYTHPEVRVGEMIRGK